uniref:Uncharacterized protein n=1 Tax=Arundo donax TaxID=35708 RepID=A0A0A9BRR3_ARUDO
MLLVGLVLFAIIIELFMHIAIWSYLD